MTPPSDAYSAQADALCDDLRLRIESLDDRAAALRAGIAKYVAAKRSARVAPLQEELRATAVERREVITLLINLGHDYPCDHTSRAASAPTD